MRHILSHLTDEKIEEQEGYGESIPRSETGLNPDVLVAGSVLLSRKIKDAYVLSTF